MDIADDNLTLPLPSALMKRAPMQRGVGFLIDDGEEEDADMDVTQSIVGGIIPPRDGVNRFLNLGEEEEDQTMEFTRLYSPRTPVGNETVDDETVGMDFTNVVGKIQRLNIPVNVDKENRPPPANDDDDDGTLDPGNF